MRCSTLLSTAAVAAGLMAGDAFGAVIDPGLTGNQQYDGWAGMTSANYGSDFSSPNGVDDWPSTGIDSREANSGDAAVYKLAGPSYLASTGIYGNSSAQTSLPAPWNSATSTFSVADSTVVPGLKTVVFQLQGAPQSLADVTLNYNGGSQALVPGSLQLDTVGATARIYQWDLTSVVDSINSIDVRWSSGLHSSITALRLHQSDVFTVAVPEPAGLGVLGLAACGLLARRRLIRNPA